VPATLTETQREGYRKLVFQAMSMPAGGETEAFHGEKRAANLAANIEFVHRAGDWSGFLEHLKAKDGRLLLVGAGPSMISNRDRLAKLGRHFLMIVADTALPLVWKTLGKAYKDPIWVINVDSDPLGIIAAKMDRVPDLPRNWHLMSQVYGAPEVVAKFDPDSVNMFTTARLDCRQAREACLVNPELQLLQTGSSCMVSAYNVGRHVRARVYCALGIDLEFARNDKGEFLVTERDPKRVTSFTVDTPNGPRPCVTTHGYKAAAREFGAVIREANAYGAQTYDFGRGLFPAPKVPISGVLRAVKHGQL